MPVHLYGHVADMEALVPLARQHGLFLLEDAAQAHGAELNGRRAGSLGDAAAFSFYPGKNLGAVGDGGAITTDQAAISDMARRLGNYGASRRYDHEDIRGMNSRLDPIQAAFLRVKLGCLERWNGRRAEIAERYLEELSGVASLTLPGVRPGAVHAWHIFCVRHPSRDALAQHLQTEGVDTLIHYPTPPHLSGAYSALGYQEGSFPIAEAAARSCLSLPIGPHLEDQDVTRVIEAVASFVPGTQ
jgi:dTDP-4-amino-4,6-dideoxygalactose transaminase